MRHIISLGAGVQSSTMALMAAHGEITPMPECAIFADTGWEPKAVYEWLDWLEKQLPFPVHRVNAGNIRSDVMAAQLNDGRCASLPYFSKGADDATEGRMMRQCTEEYKTNPLEKFIKRELLGLKPRQRSPKHAVVSQWRGISTDEASRMKPSRERWMVTRFPLAMEHSMSRVDCLMWMERKGYPRPHRSSCVGCPFHSPEEWRDIRDNRPDEWAEAVVFDKAVRNIKNMERRTYLHRQCVPLDQADLRSPEDFGQVDLFKNECEGMCGL